MAQALSTGVLYRVLREQPFTDFPLDVQIIGRLFLPALNRGALPSLPSSRSLAATLCYV